jgi:hypothetical protein
VTLGLIISINLALKKFGTENTLAYFCSAVWNEEGKLPSADVIKLFLIVFDTESK